MPEGDEQCRAEIFGPDSPHLNMPPVDAGNELIGLLMEVGPALPGPEPVNYQELMAWAQLTGTRLTPWESLTLRSLSSAYVVQLVKSAARSCPEPYYHDPRPLDEIRADVAAKFKRLARRHKR